MIEVLYVDQGGEGDERVVVTRQIAARGRDLLRIDIGDSHEVVDDASPLIRALEHVSERTHP